MDLIAELERLRATFGGYPEPELKALAQRLGVPLYRLQGLITYYPHLAPKTPGQRCLHVCCDVACWLHGANGLRPKLQQLMRDQGESAVVETCSCLGRCDTAPAAWMDDQPFMIERTANDLRLTPVGSHQVTGDRPGWRLYPYGSREEAYSTIARLRRDPDAPERVVSELASAGLRGCGGAGFPTHVKWQTVASAPGQRKYVICNADESEPGTFKDRTILATMPELVIEGMLIAALAVGGHEGFVFIRREYDPERRVLEEAMAKARADGWLGKDALGPGKDFDIRVVVSPGGYILGEETALLEAMEGRRGEPRLRPPYPATCGLHGQPTLINNVETFAAATAIVARGASWWRGFGKNGASGLKLVSVSGHVERPGVYEVELGTPIREVIQLAGGMRDGRPLKAFTPGGASAPWLGPDAIDVPLDFEALRKAGSALGTGAVIAIAEGQSAREVAQVITDFFARESCGKCVPCRLGTAAAAELLRRLESAKPGIGFLAELHEVLRDTSICGLGQSALHAAVSLTRLFPEEFPTAEDE